MTDPRANLDPLVAFTGRKRQASLTGSLVGLDLPARDRLLATLLERFEAELEAARQQAAANREPVLLDGSALSLTDGGDTWIIHPDGQLGRRFEPHPGFREFLAGVADRPGVDRSRPVATDALLEAAYQAFWAPSATNWQPTRVIEVRGEAAAAVSRLAGWEAPPADFPLLVLLRRDHYESLLGDVLEPFGTEVTAREESIDVGIFAQTLVLAALAQGLSAEEHEFTAAQQPAAQALIEAELGRRAAALEGESDELLAQERATLLTLLADLHRGRYIPDAVVAVGHPLRPVPPYPAFARVVAEHSTQRVASPAAEFGHDALMAIWEAAIATLSEADRALVRFADFSWHEQVPRRIGQAMFESLYGKGADPEAKTGGEGGILTETTVRNYLLGLDRRDPTILDSHLPAGWQDLDDAALRKVAKDVPVRASHLGRYLRERFFRDGKYMAQNDFVVDAEGRPLTVPLLVRLMKGLASTFGNFFLKFQNTHPQNAVLLVDATGADVHHHYRVVGKVAAVLTFLSRAEGATSIIKTGPIDLARDPIAAILAENPDDLPHLRPWKAGLESRAWLPAMTFQVGMPLAGSDVVEAGTPGEHSGLEERKRDKRPPREDFTWHYFPAF